MLYRRNNIKSLDRNDICMLYRRNNMQSLDRNDIRMLYRRNNMQSLDGNVISMLTALPLMVEQRLPEKPSHITMINYLQKCCQFDIVQNDMPTRCSAYFRKYFSLQVFFLPEKFLRGSQSVFFYNIYIYIIHIFIKEQHALC